MSTLNPKLPPYAAVRLESSNRGVVIKAGESGYYELDYDVDVERFNELRAVTKAQQEAMFSGSMFGWNTRGADPDSYNDDGTFKR